MSLGLASQHFGLYPLPCEQIQEKPREAVVWHEDPPPT